MHAWCRDVQIRRIHGKVKSVCQSRKEAITHEYQTIDYTIQYTIGYALNILWMLLNNTIEYHVLGWDLKTGVLNCCRSWNITTNPNLGLIFDAVQLRADTTRTVRMFSPGGSLTGIQIIQLLFGVYMLNSPIWPSTSRNDKCLCILTLGVFMSEWYEEQFNEEQGMPFKFNV